MSGSSRLSSTGAVNYFEGDVASVDDALSNDFFGDTAPDYFVLDGTEVNSVDGFVTRGIFLNTGDVDVTASTFFPNNAALVVSATPESTLGTRTTRQMFGYTAGVLQTYSSGSSTPASTTLFRNETGDPTSLNPALIDPSDVEVFTSAETNKVQADIEVSEFIESSGSSIFLSSSSAERFLADFGDDDAAFGDTTPTSGESVFVDDFAFGAGQFGGVSVAVSILEFSGSPAADAAAAAELYMVRVDTASEFSSGFLPSGVTVCDCDFLTWGFWGADIARSSSSSTELIHLANWVAGKVPAFADITTSGSAIYSGHAIGTVFNAGGVYQAIGDLAVTFRGVGPARRGQHRRAVPPGGDRRESLLQLVEGVPRGRQEAVFGRYRPPSVLGRGQGPAPRDA